MGAFRGLEKIHSHLIDWGLTRRLFWHSMGEITTHKQDRAMESILDQTSRIKNGSTMEEVAKLAAGFDLDEGHLARVAGLSIGTLAIRKRDGRFNPLESERILRLERTITRAMAVFYRDKARVKRWIESPARALGGVPPIDFLETDIGAREVENLLGRIEYGVYS